MNLCCMCGVEVPEAPNGVRSGYCSDACWDRWLVEHKDDSILYPYVPLQVSRIVFPTDPTKGSK